MTKLRRTTLTGLSASFTASKLRIGILNTLGASKSRGSGLRASSFRLTGGGSASLNVKSAFIISANGGRFVAIRRGKQRLPIKGIYAEMPNQAMGQDNAAARKAWDKAANSELATRLPAEIQLAEGLPYTAPPDTSEHPKHDTVVKRVDTLATIARRV